MNNLGNMFKEGLGVPKSEKEAEAWFKKAAQKGHVKAKRALEELQKEMQQQNNPGTAGAPTPPPGK
jgi:TPR repeat protein